MDSSTRQRLLILSGPIAVGKSSVVQMLIQHHEFRKLSSGAYLSDLAKSDGLDCSRLGLVRLGDQLDVETDFSWVVTELTIPALIASPKRTRWLFDSVRKRKQVEHFRAHLPDSVYHLHLTAPDLILKGRFTSRALPSDETTTYEAAIDTNNEREARSLNQIADRVLDTGDLNPKEVAFKAMEGFLSWSQ